MKSCWFVHGPMFKLPSTYFAPVSARNLIIASNLWIHQQINPTSSSMYVVVPLVDVGMRNKVFFIILVSLKISRNLEEGGGSVPIICLIFGLVSLLLKWLPVALQAPDLRLVIEAKQSFSALALLTKSFLFTEARDSASTALFSLEEKIFQRCDQDIFKLYLFFESVHIEGAAENNTILTVTISMYT